MKRNPVRTKNFSPLRKNRRSIRLKGYDYSRCGAYFVTICTLNRKCLFGDVVDGLMQLNDAGRMVQKCWCAIPDHFPHAQLDQFVVMPNHVHGIIMITNTTGAIVGAKNFSPLRDASRSRPCGTSRTIGSIVRGFKIGVTKWMRKHTNVNDVWQRNYWERIIRNDDELRCIREYIVNNPMKWHLDRENPLCVDKRRRGISAQDK